MGFSMGFSRQEYWSGLACPSPGDLPHPGLKPVSPAVLALQADSFTTEPLGKPLDLIAGPDIMLDVSIKMSANFLLSVDADSFGFFINGKLLQLLFCCLTLTSLGEKLAATQELQTCRNICNTLVIL